MDRKELSVPRETNDTKWADRVRLFRARYDGLLQVLGATGTEVIRSRVLEEDTVPPYRFVADARHEFIFPPQEVEVKQDPNNGVIPGTYMPSAPNNALTQDSLSAEYDASKVSGHLRIVYDDSGVQPTFVVEDLMGDSQLSADTASALTEAFVEVNLVA